MKITFLTQYYPPEIGAPQARLSELAKRIVACGHEVTVLTAMPNYPTGKIYNGYSGVLNRETMDGVKIIRTLIYPIQKTSFVRRILSYFSFVLSSLILGTFLLPRMDYLVVESPPLFLGLSALWLALIKRARLIFNVSDLWPESAVELGVIQKGSFSHRLAVWLEALCYRRSWLITGQSKSILSDILSRFPESHVFHLSNGADVIKFSGKRRCDEARALFGPPGTVVALYAGLHGIAQGLDQILDAAEHLKKVRDLRFVFVGDGPEKAQLVKHAQDKQLDNVVFLPPFPAADVPPLVASADIVLVTLKRYIPGAVPSKIYEAMASERPIVLVASGEAADIIQCAEAGIVIEPGGISALQEAILSLYWQPELRRRFGINGRHIVETQYNRDRIASEFIELLEQSK